MRRLKLVDQPIYAPCRAREPGASQRRDAITELRAPTLSAAGVPLVSPRPRVAPERRAAIVRATIRCLARDGYARLTMKRVAAEAGVSPGILHYYFRDKRAMLGGTCEPCCAPVSRWPQRAAISGRSSSSCGGKPSTTGSSRG